MWKSATPFNRTILELKPVQITNYSTALQAFNRTILELKLMTPDELRQLIRDF